MASLRKRFSRWALNSDESPKRSVKVTVDRGSIDSGYHSVTQSRHTHVPSLIPQTEQDAPRSPPRTLHKALSTTFSYLADAMRQGTALIHSESPNKEEYSSDRDQFETPNQTPKKHKRRSSLFSSVRSRKGPFSPKAKETLVDAIDSPEVPSTPTRIIDQQAPTLDVIIPGSYLDGNRDQMASPQLSARVSTSYPNPMRVKVGLDDPYINRDDLSTRVRHFVASAMAAPNSPKLSDPPSDDKGYAAEIESGPELSENDVLSPALVKGAILGPLADKSASSHPSVPTRPCFDNISSSLGRSTSHACHHSDIRLVPESCQDTERPISDVYEADEELSPDVTPSMGSRNAWERKRADRDRRYHAAMGDDSQPTVESPRQSPLPLSPSRSPVSLPLKTPSADFPSADESDSSGEAIRSHIGVPPSGNLRYDIEAAERLPGSDLPDSDKEEILRNHFIGQNPSSMLSMCLSIDDIMKMDTHAPRDHAMQSFSSDSDTDVSGNSSLEQATIPAPEDAYEAGLRAAGLTARPNSRFSPTSISDNQPVEDVRPSLFTPSNHLRSASSLSDATSENCAVTTQSPSCNAPPPFPTLHVRSEPARRISSALQALNAAPREEIQLEGPANTGLKWSHEAMDNVSTSERVASRLNPSLLNVVENNPTEQEDGLKNSFPQQDLIAAIVPCVDPESPTRPSPQNKGSLRRKRKACARIPLAESSGNAAGNAASLSKITDPQFTVKHVEANDEDLALYTDHELDDISFDAFEENINSSPFGSPKKTVCFVDNVEIIGHDDGDTSSMEGAGNKHALRRLGSQREVQRELESKQELAYSRLMEKLNSTDCKKQSDETADHDVGGVGQTDKPRWRIPSKITD